MEYSNSARLSNEFENIIVDIFRACGFIATLTDGKHHDIDAIKDEIKLAIEVKIFREIKATNHACFISSRKVMLFF